LSALTGEPVLREQLTDLQLDQVEQLRVVDGVALVERHHQVRHPDPLGEQHVLTGLRHRPVLRRDDQDRAVHLRRSRDHVLHVVGMAGHVDVGVVAGRGLVLDVGDGDGDAAGGLLRRPVDPLERDVPVGGRVAVGEDLGDRGGQGGLAVVDVTHRADVQVRFGTDEPALGHG
jgi:hypothetical protein